MASPARRGSPCSMLVSGVFSAIPASFRLFKRSGDWVQAIGQSASALVRVVRRKKTDRARNNCCCAQQKGGLGTWARLWRRSYGRRTISAATSSVTGVRTFTCPTGLAKRSCQFPCARMRTSYAPFPVCPRVSPRCLRQRIFGLPYSSKRLRTNIEHTDRGFKAYKGILSLILFNSLAQTAQKRAAGLLLPPPERENPAYPPSPILTLAKGP